MKVSETEIARCVVDYLDSIGWDVYQEVKFEYGGHVADIVGLLGKRTWVVETKTTFNLAVMEQANHWTRHSHYVSIAVPSARSSVGRDFGKLVCRERGIGVFYVSKKFDNGIQTIEEAELRRFNDRTVSRKWFLRDSRSLRGALCSEHKTFALAGNANGQHWSVFKATCQRLVRFVRKNQGCSLKQAVSSIDHHYSNDSSARGSLLHWMSEGKVGGLVVDTTRRPYRFYTPDYQSIELVQFRMMVRQDERSGCHD